MQRWWWIAAVLIISSTAEQNCPLDCLCSRPMEIDCSGSGRLTLDPSLFSGQGVRQTRHLYLHENRLTTVDRDLLAWLGQLRVLTLHNNLLMSLSSEVFYGQRNLENLTLHSNALVVLPPNIFAPMISLKVLSLGSNRLNLIHPEQFTNNILLESLDLSRNELHSLPVDFLSSNIRLQELLLNDNLLQTVPEECLNPVVKALKVLDLSGNYWQKPPLLIECKGLKSLMMSRCNISYIPDLPMSMSRLDVSYNLLQEIPDNLPVNLEVLYVTANRLETLPNVGAFPANLQNLSLSHNPFGKISPLPSSLQFLWLDYTKLRSPLGSNTFSGATQLRYLNLEGNQLTAPLGNGVFKSHSKLNTLLLTGNCLATLDPRDFTSLKGLSVLNVSNNPLHCDCGVKNTRDWARRRKIAIVPEVCDGKQWDEPLGKLDCSPKTTSTTTTRATTTTKRTTTTTTSSTSTTYKTIELVTPLMGQLTLNQTDQDSPASRREICSVLVIITVVAVEMT